MKHVIKLNIGGELKTGDVVGISYNHSIAYGWFVEAGQYGSLKFIDFRTVENTKNSYDDYVNGLHPGGWWDKKFGKGLHFKTFHKDYIVNITESRAFKISNPNEFFENSNRVSQYENGKQLLNSINFPAK